MKLLKQVKIFRNSKGISNMGTEVINKVDKLDLLELAIAGCKTVEFDIESVKNFVQSNSYLIAALAKSIEVTTFEGDVDQDEAMTVLSNAEMIKFLSGLNAHLSASV
jgi:hypothetical protein